MQPKTAGKRRPVQVSAFFAEGENKLGLELVAGERGLSHRITEATINRPGLSLIGFFQHFAYKRVQVFGLSEYAFLQSLSAKERRKSLSAFFEKKIPCIVVTRYKKVFPELIEFAEARKVPLFRTKMVTKHFVNAATLVMESLMAPQVQVQGTMIEIMGIGVLIDGRTGLGKSETALGLIRKGAALVADDITALRLEPTGTITGSPVHATRYHMEIRGLGIIHVPSLFGVASVREEKRLDMIVTLSKKGATGAEEDRSSVALKMRTILGQAVPQVLLEVAPGRDLANLVETAALDAKLRRLGHDAAKELDQRLMDLMTQGGPGSD